MESLSKVIRGEVRRTHFGILLDGEHFADVSTNSGYPLRPYGFVCWKRMPRNVLRCFTEVIRAVGHTTTPSRHFSFRRWWSRRVSFFCSTVSFQYPPTFHLYCKFNCVESFFVIAPIISFLPVNDSKVDACFFSFFKITTYETTLKHAAFSPFVLCRPSYGVVNSLNIRLDEATRGFTAQVQDHHSFMFALFFAQKDIICYLKKDRTFRCKVMFSRFSSKKSSESTIFWIIGCLS